MQWKLCQPPSPCFKENSAKPSRFDTPPTSSLFHSSSNLMHPPRNAFLFFCHNRSSEIFFFSFFFPPPSITKLHTHLPLAPLSRVAWPQVSSNWLRVELSIYSPAEPPDFFLLTKQCPLVTRLENLQEARQDLSSPPELRPMLGNECAVT